MIVDDIRYLVRQVIKDNEFAYRTYFVGGCVRDYVCGKDPKDIDIVVNVENGSKILSRKLKEKYGKNITKPCNLGHYPIYSVTFTNDILINGKLCKVNGITIEISDTMKEEFHDVNSRQRNVEFASLEEDVLRRDFSINSGLISIMDGDVVDATTFNNDIQNKIIRCNSGVDKDKIFSDDPLRILRGCVFHARFGWEIESNTKEAMKRNGYRLEIVSKERITSEIKKAFNVSFGAYRLVSILNQLELLKYIFPHLESSKNVLQWVSENEHDIRNIHLEGYSVFHHNLSVLRHTKSGIINGFASIFHDIGKTQECRQVVDGKVRFINHEYIGKKIAKKVLKEFYKLDNNTVNLICFLIENHMKMHQLVELNDKNLRRFINETENEEKRQYLFDLCNADSLGTLIKYDDGSIDGNLAHYEIQERINDLIEKDRNSICKSIYLFNGNELMQILDIKKPCKLVGEAKKILLEIQYEYGNDIDKEFAKQLLIEKFNSIVNS